MSKSNPTTSSRRQFLRQLTMVVGAGAACSLTSGLKLNHALAYEMRPDSASRPGYVFDQAGMFLLAQISAVILPKTDTPSGADVDCHGFVDYQLFNCYSKEQQLNAISIVADIAKYTQQNFNRAYQVLTAKQQAQVLTNVEKLNGFSAEQKSRFSALKSLIIFGFFTSEAGATQALRYQAVPGGFKGSIPYKKGDTAWGCQAYY